MSVKNIDIAPISQVIGKFYGKDMSFSMKKCCLFIRYIRDLSLSEMIKQLSVADKKIAKMILMGLRQAISNVKHECKMKDLQWHGEPSVFMDIGRGRKLKRWRPRARGRMFQVCKHHCNLRIHITSPVSPKASTTSTNTNSVLTGKKVKKEVNNG